MGASACVEQPELETPCRNPPACGVTAAQRPELDTPWGIRLHVEFWPTGSPNSIHQGATRLRAEFWPPGSLNSTQRGASLRVE